MWGQPIRGTLRVVSFVQSIRTRVGYAQPAGRNTLISDQSPDTCNSCEEERQYVNVIGQYLLCDRAVNRQDQRGSSGDPIDPILGEELLEKGQANKAGNVYYRIWNGMTLYF